MRHSDLYEDILASESVEDSMNTDLTGDDSEGLISYFEDFHERMCLGDFDTSRDLSNEEIFEEAEEVVQDIDYDDADVNSLLEWMSQHDSLDTESCISIERPYVFASAALENLEKDEVQLTTAIGGIGYQNSKKLVFRDKYEGQATIGDGNTGELIIKGDAETSVQTGPEGRVLIEGESCEPGSGIEGGEIKIENGAYGDVGDHMKEGTIIVENSERNVKAGYVGRMMEGGKIEVYHDVRIAGHQMQSGEIYIKGDVSEVGSDMNGGEIYIEGDVENIGANHFGNSALSGGEIRVEGEIEEILEPVEGAEIYQMNDSKWQEVS